MKKPLDGIKVIDLTHVMAGPYCTFQLVLLGADVIKVERADDGGDEFRYYGSIPGEKDCGPAFSSVNAGKRSLTLNLKSEAGKQVLTRLLAKGDVLVENFRPAALRNLGFGWEDNRRINPRLIHCSLTGFGHAGPLRDNPAYDHTVQAVCGLMSLTGDEGSAPMKAGFPMVDTFTGYMGAFAILAALLQREKTGVGQFIDVAMLDSALALMTAMVCPYLIAGEKPRRVGNRGYNGSPTSDTFATQNKPLAIGANTQKQFEALCRVIGAERLIPDPRFLNGKLRIANAGPLRGEIEKDLAKRPAEEWEGMLNAASVPAATVQTIPEICAHPHLAGRNLFLEVPLPASGRKTTILNAGFLCDHDGPSVQNGPPRLGQHTDQVLSEIGFSPEEVQALRNAGAI
jgi:CoA:oxalate CoA-transferase